MSYLRNVMYKTMHLLSKGSQANNSNTTTTNYSRFSTHTQF